MEKNNKKTGILTSFIQYLYGNVVVLLLGFISLPLTTRVLSTGEYGKTTLFTSAVSIIYIFAILGLDQAYIRYYYKEGVNRKTLFFQCLTPSFLLIVVMSIIYIIFATPFNSFLFGESSLSVIVLVVTYSVTSVFERFLFLNIRMDQNGKLYSNLNILSKALNVACIVIFAKLLGNDFRVVLLAMTISLFLVTLFIFIRYLFITRKEPVTRHSVTSVQLLRYGVPFIPILLMEWLLSSMDKWSIKYFNDFSETGIYGSAMQIMTIILTVKITFVAFWSPIAMEKYETRPEKECKEFFVDIFDKVQFLCILAAFMLTIFRDIIVLILGKDYREAIAIIPYLSLMPILSILFEMTGQGVKFTGKLKYYNYASFVAICCNLLGNTLLVPRYKGIGAALATGITYIVYFAIGTYYSKKCYPVKYHLKELIASLIIYMGYATYATFIGRGMKCSLVGVLLAVLCCLVNIRTLKSLLIMLKEMLIKLKTRNK